MVSLKIKQPLCKEMKGLISCILYWENSNQTGCAS